MKIRRTRVFNTSQVSVKPPNTYKVNNGTPVYYSPVNMTNFMEFTLFLLSEQAKQQNHKNKPAADNKEQAFSNEAVNPAISDFQAYCKDNCIELSQKCLSKEISIDSEKDNKEISIDSQKNKKHTELQLIRKDNTQTHTNEPSGCTKQTGTSVITNDINKTVTNQTNEVNILINRIGQLNTKNKHPEHNNTQATCDILEKKTISLINHILEVIRVFNYKLKHRININKVETVIVDGMDCFSYHYKLYASEMKNYKQSPDFICNSQITQKKGSVLFFTADFKFVIKTISKGEIQLAVDCLEYLQLHRKKNENTKLARIVGIYSTPKCFFIVMDNIFNSFNIEIYDLKGANINRRRKDILVEKDWMDKRVAVKSKASVVESIENDARVLESMDVMDYSFVVGVPIFNNKYFKLFDCKGKQRPLKNIDNGQETLYGIVDYLTEFNWKKKLEYWMYLLSCTCNNASCTTPEKYKTRFLYYITNNVFKEQQE